MACYKINTSTAESNLNSADGRLRNPCRPPRAAYLHIPFCAHKCGYCDFASVAGMDDLADAYLKALETEVLRTLDFRPRIDTVFVGGGTPTRLSVDQLDRFCRFVRSSFELHDGYEWTIEANPGTLDREKVAVLADHGVTRMSLGAQSFDRSSLISLERNHDPSDVYRSIDLIEEYALNWSLDLIFGAPGSTLSSWTNDLETVLALSPNHLSCYGLVYEKGTALWKNLQAGRVTPVDEDLEATMFEMTIDRLAEAGLIQYEISNYARPGFECRHNLVYWANESYFGFGLGAARYVDGLRETNIRDLPAYIRRINDGLHVTGPSERLTPRERALETATLMIRRTQSGIERDEFFRRTGYSLDELCGDAVRKHVVGALLHDDGRSVRLTRHGIMLGDTVAADFTA